MGCCFVLTSIGSECCSTGSLTFVGGIVFITWFSIGLIATALVFGFGLIGLSSVLPLHLCEYLNVFNVISA